MKVILLVLCLFLGITAITAVEYRVEAIETPVTFFAYEINNSGTIVGRFDGGSGATISNGVVSQLPDYQSNMVSARGINNHGDVVGTFRDSSGRQNGAIYRNGQYEIVEALNDGSLWLNDINDAGEATGGMFWQSSGQTKLLRYASGSLTNLGLFGGMSVEANVINDQGQIVGYSYEGGNQVPLLFENGTMTALPTLGGRWNYASGINNSGIIVGYSGFSLDPNVTDGKAVM